MVTEMRKDLRGASKTVAILGVVVIIVVAAIIGAYVLPGSQPTPPSFTVTLNGAGASFPFPLIDKWAAEYHKIKPNVQINYQSIGSGGGIRQHTEKTVQFAASDAPLTEKQFSNASGTLHIPITIGGVAVVYKLPEVSNATKLKFSGEVLAAIFLGEITKWNDPKLVELNPDANLPNSDIIVVHRSDGSGTTYIFTNYLSDVSQKWKLTVGKSTSVNWPVGLGGKGNEGVAGLVSQNPHSIGYAEFIYAKKNNLPSGYVKNGAGEFIEPSLESFAKAATFSSVTLPRGDQSWSNVSIVDNLVNITQATRAYPLTSFSYFLVYKELSILPNMDKAEAKALVDFMWWTIHDGQSYSAELFYVPLPTQVRVYNEETIRMIAFNGEQLYKG